MPAKSSGAERAQRKAVIQDLVINRPGIGVLVARGWLDAEARDDPAQITAALVEMVNAALSEEPVLKFTQEVRPLRRALKSVQSALSPWLF
jgi:hypothetical protein